MFGSYRSPVSAYRNVGVESAVSTADPHRLILLLFEGAISAVTIAKEEMRQGRIAEKGLAISKAIDIVENGLKASLNLEQGQSLAEQLDALYDYVCRRLLHANLKNDPLALDEVVHLLGEIHSAWIEIRDKIPSENSAA